LSPPTRIALKSATEVGRSLSA